MHAKRTNALLLYGLLLFATPVTTSTLNTSATVASRRATVATTSRGLMFSGSDYGRRFRGKATFYGFTTGGNCAMREALPSYANMLPVAINDAQYAGSASCGACVRMNGDGRKIRRNVMAYVHDRCPECSRGDLDLSKSGNGIVKIDWIFIPCPRVMPSFLFEGSNRFYKKVQLRGVRFPVARLVIDGVRGARSQDNFFIAMKGAGFKPYAAIAVVDIKGNTAKAFLNINVESGAVKPDRYIGDGRVNNPNPKQRKPRKPKPRKPKPRKPKPRKPKPRKPNPWKPNPWKPKWKGAKCVPNLKRCAGSKNWHKPHRCCNWKYICKWAPRKSKYRLCVPKKCIRKFHVCSGPRKPSGTKICCAKNVCRKVRGRRNRHCLPPRKK